MRWTHPSHSPPMGTRHYRLEPIPARLIGENFSMADKFRIQRSCARIVGVCVTPKTIGLPDDELGALNWLAGPIEDVSGHLDDLTYRATILKVADQASTFVRSPMNRKGWAKHPLG